MADNSYKGIFKSTFLFSFVQIVNIVSKAAVNKVVAVVLGAEGLGIISLYNTAINMLKSGCGLGIKQSAVRDVAEANEKKDIRRISEIIVLTNKVVLFTAILGLVITIVGSPLLSKYSFGSTEFIVPFIILSVAVAMNIYAEGQMAIITGMRRLRDLAKVNIMGSVVGVASSIPLYYIFGKNGIIPSLIISSLCLLIVTKVYVRRIKIEQIKLSLHKSFHKAKPMAQMGCVLMLAGFAGLAFDLLVSSFIRYKGGFETVGYFQAGTTIITGYFGIVLTAMTTDYYPRICGISKDNVALNNELNKQVSAGIILLFPLTVCFVYLAPLFISFLYSGDFAVSTQYTDYAIFGTVLIVASNCMGMIFMAKLDSKLYLFLVFVALLCQLCVYIPLYNLWGLRGLGISYIMNGAIGILLYGVVLYRKYHIFIKRGNVFLFLLVISTIVLTLFARSLPIRWLSLVLGGLLFVGASTCSYTLLKYRMGLDLLALLRVKSVNKE